MPYSTTRTVELPCVIAIALWALSIGLFILTAVAGPHIGLMPTLFALAASLILAGVACCASVRVMLIRHYEAMRNAFELGRDAGRAEAAVPLQRVH